ncbi:MAG: glycoside hydrolase family 97 catalytic domain-containing protein [Phaeodactylibacter sp.]|uniref:glycoside hydrolase family 97 protein n=1 Tax=Phaeodactylibacter sp. TaxID=1940289 RepID=UPI0032EC6878
MKQTFKHPFLLALFLAFALWQCQSNDGPWTLYPPNEAYQVQVALDDAGQLSYTLLSGSGDQVRTLLKPSALGLVRDDGDFSKGLQQRSVQTSSVKTSTYTLVSGPNLTPEHRYKEQIIELENASGQPLNLVFRAYDEGVAFRYVFPDTDTEVRTVSAEHTTFAVAEGKAWGHPYDTITKWNPAYETYFSGPMDSGTPAPWNKNGWAFPMLFETNGHWLLISEAGFDGSYGGSHLSISDKEEYKIVFAEEEEAYGLHSAQQSSTLPWSTPWRFILVDSSLERLSTSQLVTELAEPNKLEDTDWIKPGRSTWSWWAYSDSPQDYDQLVPYVDFAAEMGWRYSLVDANWDRMQNGDLAQLADYAKTKGVDLLVWYNSGGPHNSVEEAPRDRMHLRDSRRAEFAKLQKLGIKGIKVDFFQSDKQELIKQYIGILEDAADFELIVNFHGCTLPKGWRRTYPNLLTMEAVRGGECYKFDASYPERAPAHLAMLPFTRGVVGPTDYTPGGFSDNTHPHKTTYGFELALPLVLESGIIHYTDTPEKIIGLPDYAVNWLRDLPATWEETRLLAGYPGQYAIVARRKGQIWYLGGINGQAQQQSVVLDLNALLPTGSRLEIIQDQRPGSSPALSQKTIAIDQRAVRITLPAFGGFVGCATNQQP